MIFPALLTTFTLAAFTLAAPHEKRQLAQVVYSCTVPNTAALTFDDGPWVYAYDIADALSAANATGTFFFNGNNYGCIYEPNQIERVKYIYNKGHQVASHTWGHKNLATLSWDEVHDEMWRVELALQRILGVQPAFMRPPFGAYNDNVLAASHVRGQTVAIWDFDSGDSMGTSPEDSKNMYSDLAYNRHPSSILALNHDVYEQTAHNIVPHAIWHLQNAGYRLVSLAECLGMEPYQWIGEPQVNDGSWTC